MNGPAPFSYEEWFASMFKHPFTVAISVDGEPRDPTVFWHHFQDDPYPGGHRYEVVYHSNAARELFGDFPSSASTRLDRSTTNTFLHYVHWSLGRRTAEQRCEFVLNTIDTVETTDDTVRIAGECSSFIELEMKELQAKTPNQAAPGKGAIKVLFHVGRPRRALPEQQRWP